jgi:hypothetical protein
VDGYFDEESLHGSFMMKVLEHGGEGELRARVEVGGGGRGDAERVGGFPAACVVRRC